MKKFLIPLLALIWAAAVSIAYFKLYPMLGLIAGLPRLPQLSVTGAFFRHCAVLAAFIAAANGWGVFFWRHPHLTHSERLVFASASGMGIMSLIIICLNMAGIFHYSIYLLIIVIGITLFLTVIAHTHIESFPVMARNVTIVGAVPAVSALIAALAPPTQFDSLVYHLALPQRYLTDATMRHSTGNFFFAFPQGMEMLFQAAISLDRDITANLISWACYVLTALGIGTFCRRHYSVMVGTVAAAIWLWTPAFMFLATGTYVDTGLALYVFTALYAFFLWKHSGHLLWLVSAAGLSALAIGVKYTAVAPAFIIALMIAAEGKTWWYRLQNTGLFCVIVLAGSMIWFIKNAWYLHNPIAPWGTGIFTASLITAERAAAYFAHIAGHGGLGGMRELLLLPWKLTAYGFQFGGSFDMIGPVFLICVPFLFFKRGIDTINKQLLIITTLFIVVWFMTGKVLRFLMPVMPFLCVFSAIGLKNIAEHSRRFATALACVIGLVLVHNLLIFHWTMSVVDPYAIVWGDQSRTQYLSAKVNGYIAIDQCVNRLPEASTTLFFGDTRGYYCTAKAIVPTVFDEQPLIADANAATGPAELLAKLRSRGITHIYVNAYEVRRLGTEKALSERGRKNLESFKSAHLMIIYKDTNALVYEITA